VDTACQEGAFGEIYGVGQGACSGSLNSLMKLL